MKITPNNFCACVAALVVVTGCAKTRSISNSRHAHAGAYDRNSKFTEAAFGYRGELSEYDVLAIDPDRAISQLDIEQALANGAVPKLKRGGPILLVQSGAAFPDAPMIAALRHDFVIIPFSGIPAQKQSYGEGPGAYARLLRLAAARAGCETIICYWGILESGREELRTKTISWIPVAGWMLPDEQQHMRIQLKVAIIDVRSGSWTVLAPAAYQDKAFSTRFSRGGSDQRQVESLKKLAYDATAHELITQYALKD
jgi:hypothetical protein